MGVSALNAMTCLFEGDDAERGFRWRTGSSMCNLHFGSNEWMTTSSFDSQVSKLGGGLSATIR